MERRSKIVIVVVCIIAVAGIFAYSQYLSATHLSISILESKVIQRNANNSLYNMTLQFQNPSLLPINVGQTDFVISINNENLGTGTLQPLVIPPMGKIASQAPFTEPVPAIFIYPAESRQDAALLVVRRDYN